MTSPDNVVPAKTLTAGDLYEMQSYTQEGVAQAANIDLRDAAEAARIALLGDLLGGFLNVAANADNAVDVFIAALVYALKGLTGGFIDLTGWLADTRATANTAQSAGDNAQQTANNAQTAIDEIVAVINGEVDGGETVKFTFVGADGASLDGNWTSLVSGMVIRGNTAGIDAGAGSTARPGVICNTAFTADGQEVGVVLGSSGQSDQSTWILFGLNDAGTAAVAVELRTNGCALRRITRSGSTWAVAQTWATSSTGLGNGQSVVITRRKDESIYRLTRNGAAVITYDDSANTHPRTSGYWRAGFVLQRTPDAFGALSYDSFRLNSFRMTDFGTAAAVVGSQWHLFRSSTGAASNMSQNAGGSPLAASTLSVQDVAAGSVQVITLGTGEMKVLKSGPWVISVTITASSSRLTGWCGVQVSSDNGSTWSSAVRRSSQSDPTDGSVRFSGSWVLNLNANDRVRPCATATSGLAPIGDAEGGATNFSGAYIGSN